MKLFLVNLFLILSSTLLFSQAVPKVIDTLPYQNLQIIIFDDYSWKYVNHDSVEQEIFTRTSAETMDYILKNKLYEPDSAAIFGTTWDSIELFGYGGSNFENCRDTLAIPLLAKDTFFIPVQGRIFGEFTWRGARMHSGVDIDLKTGDPVVAAFSGKVRKAYYNPGGYGYMIILRHRNGLETYYAHLSRMLVAEGQWVDAGDTIALGGSTGRSTAPHLHWEVRYKDNAFNPRMIADFENSKLVTDTLILTPADFKHVKELTEAKYHYIKQGDTLWAISRKYGVSVAKLCSLNGISENSILRLGASLRVR